MAWHWGHSTSAGGFLARWLSLCCARDLLFFRFGSAPIFKTPFFSSYSTRYYFSSASFDQRGSISCVGQSHLPSLRFLPQVGHKPEQSFLQRTFIGIARTEYWRIGSVRSRICCSSMVKALASSG